MCFGCTFLYVEVEVARGEPVNPDVILAGCASRVRVVLQNSSLEIGFAPSSAHPDSSEHFR